LYVNRRGSLHSLLVFMKNELDEWEIITAFVHKLIILAASPDRANPSTESENTTGQNYELFSDGLQT
jgi:hypothetical protein